MRFRNIRNWADPDSCPGLLFFAQRMDELTFEYTLDSYKAPTTNAPFLVNECISHLDQCSESGIPIKSALYILDELENRLRKNLVAKSIISLELDKYVGGSRDSVSEIRKRLAVLRREIDPHVYVLRTMEMVPPLARTKKKKDLNFLARELATTLIALGVSPFHINHTVQQVFFSDEVIENESVLDHFFREVFPHAHNFVVCFKIRTNISVVEQEILDIFKIKILDSTDTIFTTTEIPTEFQPISGGQTYIAVEGVMATDTHDAIRAANAKVSHLHNLFRLFNHKGSFEIDESGIAEQRCCAGIIKSVPTRVNRMQFIRDNRPVEAAQKLKRFIKNLNLQKGPDQSKFFRVIDFHGMSLDTEIVENQILNLWTSFETIVPQDTSRPSITNVVDRVEPFIGLQYVRRLFRCLLFDILRWNRSPLGEALRGLDFPSNFDLIDKVFYLVTSADCEDQREILLRSMRNFELLRFRVFQLHQSFVTSQKTLKTIEQHQQRVQWQIRRIYRTRNAIIHSGQTPRFASLLVDNAHDYFDQVFDLTCELSSGDGGFMSFGECFDFVKLQYGQYIGELRVIDNFSMDNVPTVLWRPRVVPTKRHLFPSIDDE